MIEKQVVFALSDNVHSTSEGLPIILALPNILVAFSRYCSCSSLESDARETNSPPAGGTALLTLQDASIINADKVILCLII